LILGRDLANKGTQVSYLTGPAHGRNPKKKKQNVEFRAWVTWAGKECWFWGGKKKKKKNRGLLRREKTVYNELRPGGVEQGAPFQGGGGGKPIIHNGLGSVRDAQRGAGSRARPETIREICPLGLKKHIRRLD